MAHILMQGILIRPALIKDQVQMAIDLVAIDTVQKTIYPVVVHRVKVNLIVFRAHMIIFSVLTVKR